MSNHLLSVNKTKYGIGTSPLFNPYSDPIRFNPYNYLTLLTRNYLFIIATV